MGHIQNERSHIRGRHGVHPAGGPTERRARRPVLTVVIGQSCLTQFQRATEAICRTAPIPSERREGAQRPVTLIRVGHQVHPIATGIFEFDLFPRVAQSPLPAPHHIRDSRVGRIECRHVCRHHQITAGREIHVGEDKIRTPAQLPAREVDAVGPSIVELDPFLIITFSQRMIHDLVDHDPILEHRRRVQRISPGTTGEDIAGAGEVPYVRPCRPSDAHDATGWLGEDEFEWSGAASRHARSRKIVNPQIRRIHSADRFIELDDDAGQRTNRRARCRRDLGGGWRRRIRETVLPAGPCAVGIERPRRILEVNDAMPTIPSDEHNAVRWLGKGEGITGSTPGDRSGRQTIDEQIRGIHTRHRLAEGHGDLTEGGHITGRW